MAAACSTVRFDEDVLVRVLDIYHCDSLRMAR